MDRGRVRDRFRTLGIGIADLNQIANLKLSILAPIQIADLNLTSCFSYYEVK